MVEYLGTFLGIRWSGREDYYTFPWCRGESYLAVEEHLVLTVLPQFGIDHSSPRSYFQDCRAPYHHSAIRLRGVVLVKHGLVAYVSSEILWIEAGYFWDKLQKLELVKLLSKRSHFIPKVGRIGEVGIFWVWRELWVRRKWNVTLCIAVLSWVLGSVVSIDSKIVTQILSVCDGGKNLYEIGTFIREAHGKFRGRWLPLYNLLKVMYLLPKLRHFYWKLYCLLFFTLLTKLPRMSRLRGILCGNM